VIPMLDLRPGGGIIVPPLELRTIGFIVCLIVLSGLSVYIFCSVLSCIVSATLECRFTS